MISSCPKSLLIDRISLCGCEYSYLDGALISSVKMPSLKGLAIAGLSRVSNCAKVFTIPPHQNGQAVVFIVGTATHPSGRNAPMVISPSRSAPRYLARTRYGQRNRVRLSLQDHHSWSLASNMNVGLARQHRHKRLIHSPCVVNWQAMGIATAVRSGRISVVMWRRTARFWPSAVGLFPRRSVRPSAP